MHRTPPTLMTCYVSQAYVCMYCAVRALFVFLCRFSEVDIQLDKRLYDAFHAVCTYTSMVKIAVFTKKFSVKKASGNLEKNLEVVGFDG